MTWVDTHATIFKSISICYDHKLVERFTLRFVFVKRQSSDAQWHYCDVPGVQTSAPINCSSRSTVYLRPADNMTIGFGDVFSCIKGCVRRDADDLSLTGMHPCNNKNSISTEVRTKCFETVTGHLVQTNGKYSSGRLLSQNYCILLHFVHQQTQIYPPAFILDLLSGSTWQITTLRSHFRHHTLPSTYWFQIKRQYFPSSFSVCLFPVLQPHKHSHPPRKVHRYSTHTSSFLPGH